MKKIILSLIVILCMQHSISAHIDLECNMQNFIIETRKISIPDTPNGFNPSIACWKDRIFMSFRCIQDNSVILGKGSSASSFIRIVELDKNLCPIRDAQTLDFPDDSIHPQDARLITAQDHLYIVCDANGCNTNSGGFRMYVSELELDGKTFSVINSECLNIFEGAKDQQIEKNWVPFDYHGILLLAYGFTPHRILRPLLDGSNICETIANSYPITNWKWGELRGGTPALKINQNQYLAFFHSSQTIATVHSDNLPLIHYFMGAYTFDSEPPFEIQQMSKEPIIGKNFYNGQVYIPYWHPVRVIFPCGFTFNEEFIWLSYGRQDHEIWIVKIDKKALLESLISVDSHLDTNLKL